MQGTSTRRGEVANHPLRGAAGCILEPREAPAG